MFIHDIIKIKYINMGYLPNNPYYLTSDKEMFDAFLQKVIDPETKEVLEWKGVFADYYYCPGDELKEAYETLRDYIYERIVAFVELDTVIPNWVYSYMLIEAITYESDEADIAYICEMTNIDYNNALASFNEDVAYACYQISKKWIIKQQAKHDNRPPTVFGEAHVIKSLRLDQANILLDEDVS